ncbi:Murein DD-endopeptidase MepH [Halioglobus japonicus]|nr:Murein DD-endopeptidase MepH [Halioglobus japonicus]
MHKNKLNRNWRAALMLLAAAIASGCTTQVVQQAPQQAQSAPPVDKLIMGNDVLFSALGQVGIPYRYGGSSPDMGFDCSGLIQYVYAESVDIKLPRTVAGMIQIDAPTIDEANLEAGDLVIFATGWGNRPSHAGIYVGEGRFVHAPSSGGAVRMDLLSADYWQRSYLEAKRPLASLGR